VIGVKSFTVFFDEEFCGWYDIIRSHAQSNDPVVSELAEFVLLLTRYIYEHVYLSQVRSC
jgi:hypothetical protein